MEVAGLVGDLGLGEERPPVARERGVLVPEDLRTELRRLPDARRGSFEAGGRPRTRVEEARGVEGLEAKVRFPRGRKTSEPPKLPPTGQAQPLTAGAPAGAGPAGAPAGAAAASSPAGGE